MGSSAYVKSFQLNHPMQAEEVLNKEIERQAAGDNAYGMPMQLTNLTFNLTRTPLPNKGQVNEEIGEAFCYVLNAVFYVTPIGRQLRGEIPKPKGFPRPTRRMG